jgi:hypothetical protein
MKGPDGMDSLSRSDRGAVLAPLVIPTDWLDWLDWRDSFGVVCLRCRAVCIGIVVAELSPDWGPRLLKVRHGQNRGAVCGLTSRETRHA